MGGGKNKPATTQLQLPNDPTFKAIMNEWLTGMKAGQKNYGAMQELANLPIANELAKAKANNPDWAATLGSTKKPGTPVPGTKPGKGGWPDQF